MNPSLIPRIAAIETSGRIGSVALGLGPALLAEHAFSHTMRHAAELMPTLAELCRQQAWSPAQIDHVYVSTGPGSFTGVRIAISIARALAQSTGCKLVAVPTLDVLAQNAPSEVANLVVLLDAKRGQVFAAHYILAPSSTNAGRFHRVAGPILTAPVPFLQAATAAHGPLHILGEGIDYHRPALAEVPHIEIDPALWPARAAAVHQLGYALAQQNLFTPRDELLPTYIRLAEAEEVYRKKHGLPL